MKISIIQFCIAVMFAGVSFARVATAQDYLSQKVNLTIENRDLKDIMSVLESQTNIKFTYRPKILTTTKYSFSFNQTLLSDALNKIFLPLGLTYRVISNQVILTKESEQLTTSSVLPVGQDMVFQTVTGKVTDENGNPMAGVTVLIQGTQKGTNTDSKGNYKISIENEKAILLFSFIGYKKQAVVVGSRSVINVSMVADNTSLEEVVVVGYGELKKSDVTGSVSKLKVDGNEDKPIASVDQLIQGRVSGVQITQNSGAPGSGMTFLIRGASSVTGSNQPLIILDGYPIETDQRSLTPNTGSSFWETSVPPTNPLAAINPNDIESIEVLKDASSTAIYGSRGANGVVLITTKRGKNNRDQFSYSFRTDFSRLPRTIDVLRTPEFIQYANEGAINSKRDSVYKAAQIPDLLKTDSYWQDAVVQQGVSQDHQLSFTGGDEKTKYSISGNYFTQQGIIKNAQFDRGSIRINLDRQVLPKLKVSGSFNGTISVDRSSQQSNSNGDQSGSVITGALRYRPIVPIFATEGDDDPNIGAEGNPLTIISLGKNISRSNVVLANLKATYTIVKDLTFLVNTGVNNTNARRDNFQPFGTFAGRNQGYAYYGESSAFNFLIENTLNFNKTIAKKHRINAVVGYTWQEWNNKSSGVQATQFVSEALAGANLQLASTASVPVTTNQKWALQSVLGRFNYSFDNRYLFTLTGRVDGSTRLAEGNQWAFFPSVATGWNVHNEPFMKTQKFINELKVRASYGLSGNQSIGVGSSKDVVGTTRTVLNGAIITALAPTSLGNSNLGWEITRQANVGIDFTILNNKLKFGFEAYHRKTSDLLINLSLPGSTGFTSYATNFGEVENKGLEFEADVMILDGKFKWNAAGNISFNRNKVISLGNGVQLFGASYLSVGSIGLGQPANTALAGYPIGAFFGYQVNGVYQNADEVAAGPKDPTNPTPGDIKYVDTNGDGQISVADRTIIGNPYPDYTFGFTNDFRYKNFNLNVFFMGNIGQDVMNLNRHILDALTFTTGANVRTEAWEGRWQGEGTSNYYPQARNVGNAFRGRLSNFYLEDGSFIRLKNITLSYNLPAKTLKWLKGAKVYVSATNLITWTNYKGYDPEVSANATSSLTPSVDFGTVPQFRTYSTGINLTF
ncbi:SusC/RagA family TonB-linked outer membrane protein [Flectobacillus roseus]|uniref:SusC/RagA family TonB-linked outer membrane protein n=1 Tax=Flectobacillus roseus TaxID=502259 RepID=A0ABT6Y719_9BACT|nr:SusC/RagA family TonB-linked outer membrane protein [Flectobacillus roseus]MDI9859368.1 SusC/RagA family TonB-linked outer membrane protein [Flectobacillus roseus]